VESSDDSEFTEDEGIYDDLNLEDAGMYGLNADDDEGDEDNSDEGQGNRLDS
jgi:hypothetical protein